MVIVQRKLKVVFVVQTNRTLTQIRNYVNNTVYPEWDAALTTAFAGFPSVAAIVKDPRINQQLNRGTNIWEVYPKYFYQADVTAATEDAARTGHTAFLEDVRVRTRNLLNSLTGTTVLEIYRDSGPNGETEMTTS